MGVHAVVERGERGAVGEMDFGGASGCSNGYRISMAVFFFCL